MPLSKTLTGWLGALPGVGQLFGNTATTELIAKLQGEIEALQSQPATPALTQQILQLEEELAALQSARS